MQAGPTDPDQPLLATLGEQTERLADELPGSLRRIMVRSGEVTIEVEWQAGAPGHAPLAAVGPPDALTVPLDGDVVAPTLVSSPMVGTFYRAPQPGAEPYVKVGDAIDVGRVIGIVEAMKLMNPILAEIAGTVTDVLAGDAESVEFGQPLIALSPC
jgi:acetyl-CoA carboxylase biotin carboxyl carrier protein